MCASIKITFGCSCLNCTWSVAKLTVGRGVNRLLSANLNVKTGPLPTLYFNICYSFDFGRLLFLRFLEEIAHFYTAHTWSSTRLFRWESSRQHDRTPTKIASALENFPATVIMPSAWPDWSKFQFLGAWHDPAEIRTTRTTTYQT